MDNNVSTTRVVISNGNNHMVGCRAFVPSFTAISLTIFFIICLLMNGDVTPLTRRGFFCNDSSINKPFHPDTIGVKTLFFFALILPGFVIKICEESFNRLLRKSSLSDRQEDSKRRFARKRRKVSDDTPDSDLEVEEFISSPMTVKRRNLLHVDNSESDIGNAELELSNNTKVGDNGYNPGHEPDDDDDDDEETDLFTRVSLNSGHEQSDVSKQLTANNTSRGDSLRTFGEFQVFFFGLCTTMLFTGIGKITCGRLRPHFIQRCQPDVKCSEFEESNKYIEEFTCTNSQLMPRDFSYITTSWPSGHASTIFYSMLYLILYLDNAIPVLIELNSRKVKQRYDPLVMHTIYVLLISLAGSIAMTRIFDYHHHPLDVASGSILGSFIAVAVARTLSRHYSRPSVLMVARATYAILVAAKILGSMRHSPSQSQSSAARVVPQNKT